MNTKTINAMPSDCRVTVENGPRHETQTVWFLDGQEAQRYAINMRVNHPNAKVSVG